MAVFTCREEEQDVRRVGKTEIQRRLSFTVLGDFKTKGGATAAEVPEHSTGEAGERRESVIWTYYMLRNQCVSVQTRRREGKNT
jgi:hypothetical protein